MDQEERLDAIAAGAFALDVWEALAVGPVNIVALLLRVTNTVEDAGVLNQTVIAVWLR
jgi:hypothetical protein